MASARGIENGDRRITPRCAFCVGLSFDTAVLAERTALAAAIARASVVADLTLFLMRVVATTVPRVSMKSSRRLGGTRKTLAAPLSRARSSG